MSKNCTDNNCTLCLEEDPNYCIVCKDNNYTIFYNAEYRYGKKKLCSVKDSDLPSTTIITTEFINDNFSSTIIEVSEFSNITYTTESSIESSTESTTKYTNQLVNYSRLKFADLLKDKSINISLSDEDIKNIYEDIKEYLKENYTGENIVINTDNVNIQISTYDEQINNNKLLSKIDLRECGEYLKKKYCKSENDSLIILKFDIIPNEENSTYVKYEVYEPNSNKKIDLKEECPNNNIILDIPIEFESEIEEEYELLAKSGYNLFNENSSFYNDICATYTTKNGTDILIYDRRMDIYKLTVNISLCQEGCAFQSYDTTNKKAKCQCPLEESEINNIKMSNLQFKKNKMVKDFYNVIDNSNFKVMKCYKLAFKLKEFAENIGRIIMIIIIILFISLMLIYKFVSSKKLSLYLQEIIRQKLYMNSKENSNNIGSKECITYSPSKQKKKNSKNKKPKEQNRRKSKKRNTIIATGRNNPPKKKYSDLYLTSKDQIMNTKKEDSNINKKRKNSGIIRKKKRQSSIEEKNENNNGNYFSNASIPVEKSSVITFHKRNNSRNANTVNLTKMKLNTNKFLSDNKTEKENKNKDEVKELNDEEINSLQYLNALVLDKRTYFQYYISLIKKKQLIIFTFFSSNDYNLLSLKISLFIVSFSLYLTINGFFFNDDTMHKIYKDSGSFNLIYQIPQILYSSIISMIINMILKWLSLSEKDILIIKQEKDINLIISKSKDTEKRIKNKFNIFFIISLLLMLFFWYFISCFCAVYKNTQIILFKDTLISFGLSMLYPFGLNLLPGMFRIPALRAEKKDKMCLYNFSQYAALI